MAKKKIELPAEEENTLHTDMENPTCMVSGSEDGAEEMKNEALCQTDSEKAAEMTEAAIAEDEQPPEKPKRKSRTAAKKSESEDEAKPTDAEDKKSKKARPIRVIQEIVSIDDVRTVETDEDREKNDLLDLTESLKAGRILTGTVHGVEKTSHDAVAVIYHGAYKVIIPAMEAVKKPEDYHGIPEAEVHQYLLTRRLGAEFDYIVKGIDPEAKIAVASRLEAMKVKRKWHYYDIEREEGRFLYEGVIAEARVVSAIRTGIFVDLFGVETFIPLRELDYQRMMDASLHFSPGQRVLVKVLSIDRKDRNNIQVEASVKQTTENPCVAAIRKYTVGDKYVGTVSMIDTNGVFVALDGGIDCLCTHHKRGRPPRGARVTVLIRGKDMTSNRIWGVITHIAVAR